MTDNNNKIRAVVLAALMVLSVFAGTVAFAGTAAATVDSVNNLSASNVQAGQPSSTQTISFDLDDVDADPSTESQVEVDLSTAVSAGADPTSVDLDITGNNNNYTLNSGPSVSGGVITFNVTDNTGTTDDNATVTLTIDHNTEDLSAQTGVPVDIRVNGTQEATTTFAVTKRTVGNQGTVYLGETDVDISGTDGTATTFVGVSGDADGSTASVDNKANADITVANNFQTGGYDTDDDDSAELFVVEPQVTGLTLYQGPISDDIDITDGSIASSTADNERVNVEPEFNFGSAENVEITVEDEDGLEITDAVVQGSATAGNQGNISLDFSGQDTGEYTITVEGEDDLDGASRSATLTIRDEETTISLSQSTVTQGDSVVATVTGEPGDNRIIQIDRDDLDSNSVSADDVFSDTADVTTGSGSPYNNTNGYAAALLDLGDDGEAQVRINSQFLDTGSIDIEVAEGSGTGAIGNDADETAELTVESQDINVTSAPSVVRVSETFEIEGTALESDEVAAYVRIDDTWEQVDGDNANDNPTDVDSDGSFTLELAATGELSLPGNYRVAIVNEEAANLNDGTAAGTFPSTIESSTSGDNNDYGELDTTATLSMRTVEGDLTAQLSSTRIATEDEVTLSGTALGQGNVDPRVYIVGPRGDFYDLDGSTITSYSGLTDTVDVEDNEFEEDVSGLERRGTYTFIVVAAGRDGQFASSANLSRSGTIDATPQQAVAIVNDEYSGAGVDDQIVQLSLSVENPAISINDFTTDGQVAQEEVTISGTSNREDGTVVFIEVLGQNENVIASTEAEVNGTTNEWSVTIDMSDVETGTYTLRADDDESSAELEFELVSSISTPTETPEPDTDTPEPDTDTPEPDTDTPEPDTDTPEPDTDTETTSTSTPGFGVIVALMALIAAALLAFRRD